MSQEKNLWRKQPIPNSDRVGFGEVVWQAGAKPDQHVCILCQKQPTEQLGGNSINHGPEDLVPTNLI